MNHPRPRPNLAPDTDDFVSFMRRVNLWNRAACDLYSFFSFFSAGSPSPIDALQHFNLDFFPCSICRSTDISDNDAIAMKKGKQSLLFLSLATGTVIAHSLLSVKTLGVVSPQRRAQSC